MDNGLQILVKKMSPLMGERFPMPYYATSGAAGMDLCACIEEPVLIPSGGKARIPTGIAIQLPSPSYVALVFPRSGLASKYGINLANSVGVIDSDYTGEIQCVVVNQGESEYEVNPGERIAQMVIMPVIQANLKVVEELVPTGRGTGGFGSTGK
ncbi:dUTP diphosphatase [Effusibacillus consociatus]|uniref:Deoxyuridine 5'-triphosphate nucleotidohydrolase n=1 Tax=Effusibacillus consociatus TaxID=1117041 RepID=A0ABV9Q2T1_9BACL